MRLAAFFSNIGHGRRACSTAAFARKIYIGPGSGLGCESRMKLYLLIFACAAAVISGCSSPKPSITLKQLAGAYRAPPCPVIHIVGKQLSYDGQQSRFELIRIKGHDIISVSTTPRFAWRNGCKLTVDAEPSYIQVDVVDGRFAFDIQSVDGTTAIQFLRNKQ